VPVLRRIGAGVARGFAAFGPVADAPRYDK